MKQQTKYLFFAAIGNAVNVSQSVGTGADAGYHLNPNTNTQEKCWVGYYCLGGGEQMQMCPAGTYNDQQGQYECWECPPGYECPGGSEVNACDADYYYQLLVGKGACVEYDAQPGFYVRSSDQKIYQCQAGYECPGGAEMPAWCDQPGFHAPAGSAQCEECPKGYKCLQPDEVPLKCPPGEYGILTGQDTCEICPDGKQCPNGGNEILDCPPTAYQYVDHQSECKMHDAMAGYYIDWDDSNLPCPEKHSCEGGAAQPVICPNRYYQDQIGQSTCIGCPAGYACRGGTLTEECDEDFFWQDDKQAECQWYNAQSGFYIDRFEQKEKECEAGYMCGGGTALPEMCPDGWYSEAGSIDCLICPIGMKCPNIAHKPYECQPSTFSDVTGLTECKDCPPGKRCPGGSNGSKAIDCPITSYQTLTRRSVCVDHNAEKGFYINSLDEKIACPVGYKCPGGDAGKVFCGEGTITYCPEEGLWKEELCPRGKTCEWDDSTSSYIVEDCPKNKVRNIGQPICMKCPKFHMPAPDNSICVVDIVALQKAFGKK